MYKADAVAELRHKLLTLGVKDITDDDLRPSFRNRAMIAAPMPRAPPLTRATLSPNRPMP
jgi:hypothetical protein